MKKWRRDVKSASAAGDALGCVDELVVLVRSLPFETRVSLDEGPVDLGRAQWVEIEDPHQAGLPITLLWMPSELIATLGRGVSVELENSRPAVEVTLSRWMSDDSVESLRRNSIRVVFESEPAETLTNTRGWFPHFNRNPNDVRRYTSYRSKGSSNR